MKKLLLIILILTISNTLYSNKKVYDNLESALKGVVLISVPQEAGESIPIVFGISKSESTEPAYKWKLGANRTGASGFVVEHNRKKYIITNAHVVEILDSNYIIVYGHDGTKYETKLVGGDTFYDIAVLEFIGKQPGSEIKPLKFRSLKKNLRVGETVYAIGHPLLHYGNHQFSVTKGIISGKSRIMNSITAKFGQIQHTAFLADGNSGGPLIDENAKIVGLNTQIGYAPTAYTELGTPVNIPQFHINFSSEYQIVYEAFKEIVANKRIQRAFVGFELREHRKYNTTTDEIRVAGIVDGSPVHGKIQKGSIIKNISGKSVTNIDDVLQILEETSPNSKIEIVFESNGSENNVSIQSDLLNSNNLGKISKYLIKKYTNFNTFEDDDVVYLSRKISPDEKIKRIFTAGDISRYWKVATLADLGKILRICSLMGFVQIRFYNQITDSIIIKEIFIPSKYNQSRTLIY